MPVQMSNAYAHALDAIIRALIVERRMDKGPEAFDPASARFAGLLNHLFDTRRGPSGRPYTLAEVSKGTGGKLSSGYISLLRRGGIVMPPADRVQALADFFGVDVGYFTGRQPASPARESEVDEVLRRALADPLVRQIALRASEYGPAEQAFVLSVIESADALLGQRSGAEQSSDTATPLPPDTGTADKGTNSTTEDR